MYADNRTMQNIPEISIVIPVYNTEEYLDECLTSVLAQTYVNIEVICVDDGSTDGSAKIMQEFVKRDSRVRVISQKNSGVAVARNVGLEAARGKYVYFVDSDDTISFELCDLCRQTAEHDNCDMVMILLNESEEEKFQTLALGRFKHKAQLNYDDKSLLMKFPLYVSRFFFKREFLNLNKIEFPRLRVCEDMVFNIRALVLADRIRLLDKRLYNYRIRSGSATSPESLKKNKTHFDYFLFLREVKFLFDKTDYLPCLSYVYGTVYSNLYTFYYQLSKEDRKIWKQKFNETIDERDVQYLKTKSPGLRRAYRWHFYRQFWGNKLQRTFSWWIVISIDGLRKISFLRTLYRTLSSESKSKQIVDKSSIVQRAQSY